MIADRDSTSLRRPSPHLTFDEAVEVWQRYWRGAAQHHIAQAFSCNPRRINEILKEKRHVGSRKAALATKVS